MQEGLSRSLLSFLGVFDCSWAVGFGFSGSGCANG